MNMPTSNLNKIACAPVEIKILSESDNFPLNSGIILLIDDDKMVVKITEAMLKKIGYKIIKAYSGQEALNLFQKYRNQIDLIICDMIMPNMNGFELGYKLRKIDPRVKLLLSSGSLIDEDEKDIANRGFDGLIKKPYKLNDLSQKIDEILR
jgi:CheY-like chemotaxis protein